MGIAPDKTTVLILAPFFGEGSTWIDDFCQRRDLHFKKIPYPARELSWHARSAKTPLRHWVRHFQYTRQALSWKADCVVTCFPQLALCAATLLAPNRHTALIAWNFNVGSRASRSKGWLAGRLLERVDRFVVHSTDEIRDYARWLHLDEGKFRFVPLQKGRISSVPKTGIEGPYVVSMGSANRDYATLVEAVRGTGIKTVIISSKTELDRLPNQSHLIKLHGLTQDECNAVLMGAEVNVVPLLSADIASGQVTLVTAMRLGVPTIATRASGTVDYFEDAQTGVLVPSKDPTALRKAIQTLWNDPCRRFEIGNAAKAYAERRLSDEAIARSLEQIIDEVLARTPQALQRARQL